MYIRCTDFLVLQKNWTSKIASIEQETGHIMRADCLDLQKNKISIIA